MNQYNLFKWRFTIDNEITEILGVAFELLDLILIEHIPLTGVKSCSLFLFKNSLKVSNLVQATTLARETLLSLTSKQTGEWFKEEIRLLGGLDHVIDTGAKVFL